MDIKNDRRSEVDVVAPSDPPSASRISAHPMSLAIVSGLFGVAVAFIGVYFASSQAPDLSPRVSDLEQKLEAANKENEALRKEVAELQKPETAAESITVLEHGSAGIMEKSYLVTVDKISGGVAEMSFRKVTDTSGFIDRKQLSEGDLIRLSTDALSCTVAVTEVMGFAVKVFTQCVPVSR